MQPDILSTPPSAFEGLPDYPFAPHFLDVGGVRIHYVDEGPSEAPAVFLLHGQPSWSYLYRHMIPVLVEAGYRVIAPDLVGFGKSDKPTDPQAHTYAAHVRWMTTFVRTLGVRDAAAFMQDWGGMIGLRVLAAEPTWLKRLVIANTALAAPKGLARVVMPWGIRMMRALSGRATVEDFERSLSFRHWLSYFSRAETLEIGRILQALTVRELSAAEMAAYDAPYPDPRYQAGPRRLPALVATDFDAVAQAWTQLERWPHPVLTLFSDKDPFLAGTPYEGMFQDRFPGAKGQPHRTTTEASHFLQEDKGPQLARRVLRWLDDTGFRGAATVQAVGA